MKDHLYKDEKYRNVVKLFKESVNIQFGRYAMNSLVKVLQYQLFMIPNGQLLRSSIYKAIFLAVNNF